MLTDPRVSACIVLYQSGASLLDTVECVLSSTEPVELYLVDNDPKHSSEAAAVQVSYPQVHYTRMKRNVGFGAAHNTLCGQLHSTYHLILNPDVTFEPDLIARMVAYMDAHKDIAILTPRVFFPDGQEQFVPRLKPNFGFLLSGLLEKLPGPLRKLRRRYTLQDTLVEGPMNVQCATGCFLLIRTQVFYRIKGFDPRFFLYMEDCDLTLRALEQGAVVYNPDFCITHQWHRQDRKSRKLLWTHLVSAVKFLNKWGW